jgi:ComF family protein
MKFHSFLWDFFGLFYPRICAGCNNLLYKNEEMICTNCIISLPKTNYHTDPENETAKIFWGRKQIENASSYLYFRKGGIVQRLLHKLKYKGEKEIGLFLGKLIGYEIINTPFCDADIIVPVPLHKKKLAKRGYNQSEIIAKGISEVLNKPVVTDSLKRVFEKTSQTSKHRYDRWLNVNEIFEIKCAEGLANKHILLVDDVVTTGATIEACVEALQKCENTKISIITVAKA